MGPNVKFVSPICGLISDRKDGDKFLCPEKDHTGGVKGGMVKDHKFSDFFSRPLP